MKLARLGLALCALSSCDAPSVFPGADPQQNERSSRIEGTAIVNSTARGRVLLFLYDAANPPPPAGSGAPVNFAVVPSEVIFGSAVDGDPGPFAAPFAFSLVSPGRYLVRGFVDDRDDFIPQYSVANQVNAGDVGGAALDAATRAPRVIAVETDASGAPLPVTGVPVTFSDSLKVAVDRPAFEVSPASLELTGPASVTLKVKRIDTDQAFVPSPVFLASLVDSNGDGAPDDSDGDGIPDFWPRVVVRKIADGSLLADEAVALQAGFDFSSFQSELVDGSGKVKTAPTPRSQLSLSIRPRAFDISNPSKPVPLEAVPPGRYSITVIQSTGQTWRVPNELAPSLAEALGFTPESTQGTFVEVR